MVSGGDPGVPEASHAGAWFAGKDKNMLHSAAKTLSEASSYTDKLWLDKAFEVLMQ